MDGVCVVIIPAGGSSKRNYLQIMTETTLRTPLLDYEPETEIFLADVLRGLNAEPRSLPCKYFYDERGSQLFDAICGLDEYYLTRTELSIMRTYAKEMAAQIGSGVMLVEYGSGSSIKTRLLLESLEKPIAYVPVDISRDHLLKTAQRLSRRYPNLEVLPVCADFTQRFELPTPSRPASHCAVYFPGSTIGNLQPDAAQTMLQQIANLCGDGGGLLIGIDLQKDASIIEAAYNDAKGVTAEFNLNLLRRINRELSGDFDLRQFEHDAVYDDERGRVEISLRSQQDQIVTIGGHEFQFSEGEKVRTEFSHKYTIGGFAELAARSHLTLRRYWTDEQQMFGVLHFAIEPAKRS